MTAPLDFYSFVYRGVLADVAVQRALPDPVANGEPKQIDADIQRRLPLEILDDSLVIAAKKMAWVYTAIAAFENSVRAFVEVRLLETVGPSWWDSAISSTIKKNADARVKEEEQIRWHGARGSSRLAYVQLDDLGTIIQNNHEHFRELVPSFEWAREIFRSLTRSRNVIMHSGQLTLADVERVAMNIRDWSRQVGG